MGQMPMSARSALPSVHSAPLKRQFSEPLDDGGHTPPSLPEWTRPGYAEPKRSKQGIPETQISDPIVAQYANADPTELVEEPYSPTREEAEAPYDPSDVMDDIGEVRRKNTAAAAAAKLRSTEGGTPPGEPPSGKNNTTIRNREHGSY